ncbi:cytochrome C biogenesis protein CcdA [Longimycelium tulufanense]|uniref:Cytochrome C biogenesis protein CcdA n=2 Tax=Longimycelium tulufanense TaxID=907463 RepID=A0A8J3CDN6_9PSEU|nr:cytochrome C biogenesis protein CcdA [Longimycelium tulufanense]
MIAAVSPCAFTMLLAYVLVVVAGGRGLARIPALRRALVTSGVMAAGFVATFGVGAAVVASVTMPWQDYAPVLALVVGFLSVMAGILLVAGRNLPSVIPGSKQASQWVGPTLGYGAAYAAASLGCALGPFIATIDVPGSTPFGVVLTAIGYGVGFALVVAVPTAGVSVAMDALNVFRRLAPHIPRITGVLLFASGFYVFYYATYLLRSRGKPGDPVVETTEKVRSSVEHWLTLLGPGPLVAVLLLMVAVPIIARRRRGRAG